MRTNDWIPAEDAGMTVRAVRGMTGIEVTHYQLTENGLMACGSPGRVGYAEAPRVSLVVRLSRLIAFTADSATPASATFRQWSGNFGTTGTSAGTAPAGPTDRRASGVSRAHRPIFRCAKRALVSCA